MPLVVAPVPPFAYVDKAKQQHPDWFKCLTAKDCVLVVTPCMIRAVNIAVEAEYILWANDREKAMRCREHTTEEKTQKVLCQEGECIIHQPNTSRSAQPK